MPQTFIRDKALGLRRRLYGQWFDLLGECGLSAYYAKRYAGAGVIFMFHRIIEPEDITLEPGYAMSTAALEAVLQTVRQAGWAIVSLVEMRASLLDDPSRRRMACFTFDDGYLDNCTLAPPIFRRYSAPFCVYLSSALVDRTVFYWWGALERLVLTQERLEIDIPDNPLRAQRSTTTTLAAKRRVSQAIDGWCHEHPSTAEDILRPIFLRYGVDDRVLLDREALSVDQIRQLGADPLVTIGSHGVTHCAS